MTKTKRAPEFLGFCYEAKSKFNGAPIVVVITLRKSKNEKTGKMLQTWILDTRANPVSTSKSRRDRSICGSCPQRRSLKGACYVTLHQAPLSVYRAYKRGRYIPLDLNNPEHLKKMKGRPLRMGSYGDPMAVESSFWKELIAKVEPSLITGYSHSWDQERGKEYQGFLMASVDSPKEFRKAQFEQWRTFRVKLSSEDRFRGEAVCPASEESGFKRTCSTCGICDGNARNGAGVVINVHGALASRFTA